MNYKTTLINAMGNSFKITWLANPSESDYAQCMFVFSESQILKGDVQNLVEEYLCRGFFKTAEGQCVTKPDTIGIVNIE